MPPEDGRRPAAAVTGPWPGQLRRWCLIGGVPAALFLAHLLYGAYLPLPALVLSAVMSALLLVCLAIPSTRQALLAQRVLVAPAALFALLVALLLASQTAALPGPHPLWAWAGLPPAVTLDRSATTLETIKLIGFASVFLLGAILGASARRARAVVAAVLVLGAGYAVVAVVLYATQAQLGGGPTRLTGGFYSANSAGTLFGMLLALSAAWALQRLRRTETLLQGLSEAGPAIGGVLLFLACLVATGSRGAVLSTAVAVLTLLAWTGFRSRARLPLILGGAVAAAVLVLLAALIRGGAFLDRLSAQGLSSDARQRLTEAHWEAFLASPLFGYGLGAFGWVNNQLISASSYAPLAETNVLHNAYLQWLEEGGVVGAAIMFALVAVIVGATVVRAWGRRSDQTLIAGLVAATVVVVCHAWVDVSLQTPSLAAFWSLLLGLGCAYAAAAASRRRSGSAGGRLYSA